MNVKTEKRSLVRNEKPAKPNKTVNTECRWCCCTMTFRILHFEVLTFLKCKIFFIGFLDELGNFKQNFFLHFKMQNNFTFYSNGPVACDPLLPISYTRLRNLYFCKCLHPLKMHTHQCLCG